MEFLTMRLYIFHVHTLLPLMEVFFCFSKEYIYNNRRHFSVITAALVAEYLRGEGVTWVKQVYIFLFSNLQLWSIFFLNYLASMYDHYSNSYQFFYAILYSFHASWKDSHLLKSTTPIPTLIIGKFSPLTNVLVWHMAEVVYFTNKSRQR